jgi:lysyl-tRNA synthetase class 1
MGLRAMGMRPPGPPMENKMSDLRETALTSKAWPFEEARRVLKRYAKGAPEKGFVLFETGYGPSGLPHIGTFGEVARTTMIKNAFEVISDIPTKLICFSDDLDGMRKVPGNVPDADSLVPHLQKPLTSVPDPFGTHESFGHHNNAMLRRFLDTFGFEYEFYSATEFYGSGRFDEVLKRAVDKYDEIMEVMLASLREERRQTYSIFLPFHPETGRVLYVPIKVVDAENYTITFDDEEGREWTVPVTGGNVKLQWKPDFGARWAALEVDFEMYGKDHSTNTPIYDKICRILGHRAPDHFTYELFLDANGQKISKTSGNGISIDEWLTYASAESLSYFMYQKPKTAKRMHFDVIPKAVDEYHQQLRAYATQDTKARLNNPVWHIHAGDVPASDMVVPFSMLLNLASASSAEDKATLWGFINKYAPDATPESNPTMDQAAGFAVAYFNDYVKPSKVFRAPSDVERAALRDLAEALKSPEAALAAIARKNEIAGNDEALPEADLADADFLQSVVFAIGKIHGFDPLRDWFTAIYEVLLGASQGPRFGGFIALYGVQETIAMIDKALAEA